MKTSIASRGAGGEKEIPGFIGTMKRAKDLSMELDPRGDQG
jgi:hypothetical protein